MNIFFLDHDPEIAASYHCDQHINKMLLESTQLLFNSYYIRFPGLIDKSLKPEVRKALMDDVFNGAPKVYRPTHLQHGCSKWVADRANNFDWLLELAKALAREFVVRYNKNIPHACEEVLAWMGENKPDYTILKRGIRVDLNTMSMPYQAMPTTFRNPKKPVLAYRNYYIASKTFFRIKGPATWANGEPKWIYNEEALYKDTIWPY
jgi:hypothetical protein